MDWLDLLAVQGTLKNLLQRHSSKASILRCSAFFIVQLSHPYMTTGKTIALTRPTFIGKVMSLLFNMLLRLVITFLPRSLQMAEQIIFILFKPLSLWYFVTATLQSQTFHKKSYDQPRQHIKKQRHYFANKCLSSQGYGFSSSHVWM